jgi:hypothetical protein
MEMTHATKLKVDEILNQLATRQAQASQEAKQALLALMKDVNEHGKSVVPVKDESGEIEFVVTHSVDGARARDIIDKALPLCNA